MNNAILLYSDHALSTYILPKSVCEYFKADNFNLNTIVRDEILKETPLAIEMKRAMDKGELIPDEIFDKLIENFITLSKHKTIVFSNYPFTSDKYGRLINILDRLDYSITNILIFLQLDPEDFLENYFREEIPCSNLQKFGEEVIENWRRLFTKRRNQINEVLQSNWCNNYQTIKMPYEPNLSNEFILNVIKRHL